MMQRSVGAMLALSLPIAEGFTAGVPLLQPAAASARSADVLAVAEIIKPLVNGGSSKPALGDLLPDCPSAIWEPDGLDVDEWQAKYKAEQADAPACPLEIHATPKANAKGLQYFIENRGEFAELLQKHGTIWFRGFEQPRTPTGSGRSGRRASSCRPASTRSTRRACASSSRKRTPSTRRSTSRRSRSTLSGCTRR